MVLCLKLLRKIKIQKNNFMELIQEIMVSYEQIFSENIIKNLIKANMISISPLEMIVKNKKIRLKSL